jgi:hypothetical protein
MRYTTAKRVATRAAKSKRKKTRKGKRKTTRKGKRKTPIRRRPTIRRRPRVSYKMGTYDYLDSRPSDCGDVCTSWHKRTAGEKYTNPRKMVDAYEAVEKTAKYRSCCAPDAPLSLMEDLSRARDRMRYGTE